MTDVELRSALHQRFGAAPPMPDEALRAVLEHIPETPQERRPMSPPPPTSGRFRTMFNATNTVAASVAVFVVAVALPLGLQQAPTPTGPDAAIGGSPTSFAPAGTTTVPVPVDPEPSSVADASSGGADEAAGQSPHVHGPGPWITWERAPEFDGRVDAPGNRGYGLRFEGGGASRSNKNKVADGYDPLRLRVSKPDGSVEEHTIDRNYKVARWAALDDRVLVVTKAGMPLWRVPEVAVNRFVRAGRRNEDCCEIRPDGTIITDGSGGLPRRIPFARWSSKLEGVGLELGDLSQPRHHLLWRDGEGWTEVSPSFGRVDEIVGTSAGFYAVDVLGRVHHSPDGEAWQTLPGDQVAVDGNVHLVVAGGDSVVIDDLGASLATPAGVRRLPFIDSFPSENGLVPGFGRPTHGPNCGSFHRPDIGTVVYDPCNEALMLSPDDGGWGLVEMRIDHLRQVDGELIATLPGLGDQAFRAVATEVRPE